LALESIGDTVYVAGEGVAIRREVQLGFREGDWVEILSGVAEGERIVTVGQDGLAEGTPIQVLEPGVSPAGVMASAGQARPPGPGGSAAMVSTPHTRADSGHEGGPGGGQRPDIASMTPEQLDAMKERMRSFGMTDEQIQARLERLRESQQNKSGDESSSN